MQTVCFSHLSLCRRPARSAAWRDGDVLSTSSLHSLSISVTVTGSPNIEDAFEVPYCFSSSTPTPGTMVGVIDILSTSWEHVAIVATGLVLMYTISIVVYRLYLSPIANIPGPRLAAATFWYEYYFDVVKQGRYTWRIGELHDQYGKAAIVTFEQAHS